MRPLVLLLLLSACTRTATEPLDPAAKPSRAANSAPTATSDAGRPRRDASIDDAVRGLVGRITPGAGIVMSDGGATHVDLGPSFDKHPKDHVEGVVNKKKVTKVSFECIETGWRLRVATAPNAAEMSLYLRLDHEPQKGDELTARDTEGSAEAPGIRWGVLGHYLLSIEKWDLKGEYKGKESVAGTATGRLSWVPEGDNGIKLTPVGGRFVDAPLRYAAKCNIPVHR